MPAHDWNGDPELVASLHACHCKQLQTSCPLKNCFFHLPEGNAWKLMGICNLQVYDATKERPLLNPIGNGSASQLSCLNQLNRLQLVLSRYASFRVQLLI